MVLAEKGPFKTPFRGEFDKDSLSAVASLINKSGSIRSRFGHASFLDSAPGKFLGRVSNARLDGNRVRGDLVFDNSAFDTPNGNLADYVMRVIESDPELGLSSSLVLEVEEEFRLNKDGTVKTDEDGLQAPPLWRPLQVFASDIVDEGDAVHGPLLAKMGKAAVEAEALRMLGSAVQTMRRFDANIKIGEWAQKALESQYGKKSPESQARIDRAMLQRKRLTLVRSEA